jgi:hypothetical protein
MVFIVWAQGEVWEPAVPVQGPAIDNAKHGNVVANQHHESESP